MDYIWQHLFSSQFSWAVLNFRSWLNIEYRLFYKNAAQYLTIGPKKGIRVRKLQAPTDTVSEFVLGTQWQISS